MTRKRVGIVLGAVMAASALASCSGDDGTTASSTVTTTETATATTTAGATSSSSVPTTPAGNGCVGNDAKVPAGANVAKSPDLDRDGETDAVWLADVGGKRTLGVQTATGATFWTTFTAAAPQAARAIGAFVVDDAGVILLDTGRSVSLYAVVNCEIVPSQNTQGKQYTFDKGFTGYGTGVSCAEGPDGLVLAGELAKETSGGRFDVTRTAIDVTDYGRKAANGKVTTVATGVAADSAAVQAANSISCGTSNSGATEPQ